MSVKQHTNLIDRDGWELDHASDTIAEWLFDIDETVDDKDVDNRFDKFVLTIQEQDPGEFTVSIGVTFTDTSVGDLLGAKYSQVCPSIESAASQGLAFCQQVEESYLKD